MFGTIGHARIVEGHETQLAELNDEWKSTILPMIPGVFFQAFGSSSDESGVRVFLALAEDEATYRNLAAMPEQDAWFRRLLEHIEGEPTWEDVEMEYTIRV